MNAKVLAALLVVAPMMFPLGVNAADGKSGSDNLKLVSAKEINSRGLKATLKGGMNVKITKLEYKKGGSKECSLDVGSLKSLSPTSWKPMGKGATATINLQARVGPKGHPFCSGDGSGCVMTVEIPDASGVADRLMR